MKAPVLFLIFNRPELTRQSFNCIREARPEQLFVAADGPRINSCNEEYLCAEVRKVAEQVNWECEVKTLFRDNNLGCRKAISSAINWFFEHVEEGIILEDDCIPDSSFFGFCEELLERYRNDEEILVISGDNHQCKKRVTPYSYYFSKYPHCWGWASWRRAWLKYDDNMKDWPRLRQSKEFSRWFYSTREKRYWTDQFERRFENKYDTWAVSWVFACWLHRGLTILPEVNLVENIGWGVDATHTVGGEREVRLSSESLGFPLHHPEKVFIQTKADIFTDRLIFSGIPLGVYSRLKRLRWRLIRKLRNIVRNIVSV